MSHEYWTKIESLFFRALERSPQERAAFLKSACDDDDLRREVEGMLEAHEPARRLRVEDRLLQEGESSVEPPTLDGREVGAYRLIRLLGRGGMGDVYLAERSDDQYEREVALKLIRPGPQADDVQARFIQERQILASLEHPNIATLLDGGVTDEGQPYLVMQHVDGVPITDYCLENGLDLRERLQLFQTVCKAVHAAHVNLVVHRDLKPANILVTRDGVVKLLDFGIAKLLEPGAGMATRAMDRILTPEHAAPEQLEGRSITTATDVYALGVLLYQLLTGRRPLEFPSSTSSREIERRVLEFEPEPPSSVGGARARALRGELDQIVLMALRKEPERRYGSALEFGDDVQRFLTGQPVRAERDTVWYRSRKFLRRNRAVVAVGVVIVASIVTTSVFTAVQSRKVAQERDRAEAARAAAVVEQAKSEEIIGVLTELLGQANPFSTPGGDTLRVSDFIDQIGESVAQIDHQPGVQARMFELLGDIHRARSSFETADDVYERALEYYEGTPDGRIDAARVRHNIAVMTITWRGAAAAEPLLRDSLQLHREMFGPDHRDVGTASQDLAGVLLEIDPEEAARLLEDATRIADLYHDEMSLAMAAMANRLGMHYRNLEDFERASENFERSLEILLKHVPADHPNALTVQHNLLTMLTARGLWTEAAPQVRELIATRERVLGHDSVPVARSYELLGTCLGNTGELEGALDAFRRAAEVFHRISGPYNDNSSLALYNMSAVYSAMGRSGDALAYLDSSLTVDARLGSTIGLGHVSKQSARAYQLYCLGEREQGIALARRAVSLTDSLARPEQGYRRADVRRVLAVLLLDQRESVEAESLMRYVVEQRLRLPESHPRRELSQSFLGVALSQQGRRDEARRLLEPHIARALDWGMLTPLQRSLLQDALHETGLSAP